MVVKKTMKVFRHLYIAGPMSGFPKKNFPEFKKAAKKLRKAGYRVISPAELEIMRPLCVTWEECLRRDLRYVLTKCYGMATLPGCKKSRGATLEVYVAKQLDMQIHTLDYWLDRGR